MGRWWCLHLADLFPKSVDKLSAELMYFLLYRDFPRGILIISENKRLRERSMGPSVKSWRLPSDVYGFKDLKSGIIERYIYILRHFCLQV